jgi:dTDP-glucose 4,6-dehydratase
LRILVTGGCGFIGSSFIRTVLSQHPEDEVVNLDLLTYAGNPDNLQDVEADYADRYKFMKGDVCDTLDAGSAGRGRYGGALCRGEPC